MPRKTRTKATPVDINEEENGNGRKVSNPRSGRKSSLDSEVKATPTNAGRSRRSSTAAQTAASVADSHTPRRRGRRGSSASSESNAKSREASPQSRSHARRALKQVSYIESDTEDKEEDKLPEEEYNAEEEDLESESGDSSKGKLKTSSPSRKARSTPRSARSSGRRRPTGKSRGKKVVQSPKKKTTPSRRSRNVKVESEEEESDKKNVETPTLKRSSRTEAKKKGKYTEVLSDDDDEKSSESEKAPPAKKAKSRRNVKAESEEEESDEKPVKNETPIQKRSPRTAAKKKGKYTEPVSDDDEKAGDSTKKTKRRRAASEDEASNNEEEKPTSTRASRAVNRSSENRPVATGRRALRGRNKNNSVDEEINDDLKKDKRKRPLSDNEEEDSKAKRSKNDANKKLDLEDDDNPQDEKEGLESETEKMDESDDKPKTDSKVAITDCSVKISLLKNYDTLENKDDKETNEIKSKEGELSPGKKEGGDGDLSSQEEEEDEDKSSTKKKEEDDDEEEDDSTSEKIQENEDSSQGKKDGSSPGGYNGDSSLGRKDEGDNSMSGKKEQGDESTSDGKKEDKSCPEMEEEDECSPTKKDEDKCSSTKKDEVKCSPTKKDEDKSSPTKKDEDKSSPTKKDEDKSSPTKKDEDKSSPTKKDEDKSTPANEAKSSVEKKDEDKSPVELASKQTDPIITPKSKEFQLTTNNNNSDKSTSEVNNVTLSLEKSDPKIITHDDKESKVNQEKNENRKDSEPEKEPTSLKTFTQSTENINNNSGTDNEARKPQSPSSTDRQKKILNGLLDAHSSPEFNNIFHGRKFIINQNVNDEVWSRCHDRTFGVVCYNLGGEAPRPLENFVSSLKLLKSELVCMQGVNEMFHKGYLESTLNGLGYKGIFSLPKGQNLGFSVFFKTTLLKLKNQRMVSLKDLISKELENLLLPNELVSVLQQLRTCGDVFLSSFELSLPGNQATNLVLANISIPRSDLSTHALQMACLAREALGFLENPSNPLIICGGFNMTSTDPSYQLLKDGYLSNDMIETLQTKKDIKVPGKEDNTALINLLWKSFQHSATGLKSCYSAVYEKEVVSPASSEMIWFSSSSLHTLNILEALPESKAPENSLNFNKHIMLKATLSLTS